MMSTLELEILCIPSIIYADLCVFISLSVCINKSCKHGGQGE